MKTKKRLIILLVLLAAAVALAQPVVIGTILRLTRTALASFPAAAAINEGGLLYDDTNNVPNWSDGTQWIPVAQGVPCSVDCLPRPEGASTGNSTRVAQTTFDGAAFTLDKPTIVTALLFRTTGVAGAPTGRFLIYQAPFGGAGTANLIASITTTTAVQASGNHSVAITPSPVTLAQGRFFLLYGRDSAAGSFTMQTRTTQALNLLNANVELTTHPTAFTTTIAATTSPATFDPREAPTGQATGTSSDVTAILRLQ